jgi:hypothetical protein
VSKRTTVASAAAGKTKANGYLGAWALSSVEAGYIFYWVFGTWLPWYGRALMGLFVPVMFPAWLLLWLTHFVPAVIWPLVK